MLIINYFFCIITIKILLAQDILLIRLTCVGIFPWGLLLVQGLSCLFGLLIPCSTYSHTQPAPCPFQTCIPLGNKILHSSVNWSLCICRGKEVGHWWQGSENGKDNRLSYRSEKRINQTLLKCGWRQIPLKVECQMCHLLTWLNKTSISNNSLI